jgi:Na+/melibiose symporter-like transporter
MLAVSGYVANAAQTPAVLTTMLLTVTALPAALAALAIVTLLFYPLSTDRMREVTAQIGEM